MPILDVFWAMLWFLLFIAGIWLVISIIGRHLQQRPFRCLVYLIVHGGDMQDRRVATAIAADQAQRDYIRGIVGEGSSAADEIAACRLARPGYDQRRRVPGDEDQAARHLR